MLTETLAFILCLTGMHPAGAGNRIAILIAVDDQGYPAGRAPLDRDPDKPLLGAASDLRLMTKLATDANYEVWSLSEKQVTRAQILSKLSLAAQKAKGADAAVLIYFSGRGSSRVGTSGPVPTVLPSDWDPGNPRGDIGMDELESWESSLDAGVKLAYIVDASFTPPVAGRKGIGYPPGNANRRFAPHATQPPGLPRSYSGRGVFFSPDGGAYEWDLNDEIASGKGAAGALTSQLCIDVDRLAGMEGSQPTFREVANILRRQFSGRSRDGYMPDELISCRGLDGDGSSGDAPFVWRGGTAALDPQIPKFRVGVSIPPISGAVSADVEQKMRFESRGGRLVAKVKAILGDLKEAEVCPTDAYADRIVQAVYDGKQWTYTLQGDIEDARFSKLQLDAGGSDNAEKIRYMVERAAIVQEMYWLTEAKKTHLLHADATVELQDGAGNLIATSDSGTDTKPGAFHPGEFFRVKITIHPGKPCRIFCINAHPDEWVAHLNLPAYKYAANTVETDFPVLLPDESHPQAYQFPGSEPLADNVLYRTIIVPTDPSLGDFPSGTSPQDHKTELTLLQALADYIAAGKPFDIADAYYSIKSS